MEIPVYVFTGLLESGKTTLIQEVVKEEDFLEPGTTVLVQCEEGEAVFDKAFLDENSIIQINVGKPQDLSRRFWSGIEKDYAPTQILVEYNGMWDMEELFSENVPEDWYAGGVYSTVNAETAEIYMKNMRKAFMEQLKASNLIIFNRCDEDVDRMKFRRAIKMLNPEAQLAFERKDGKMFENEIDVMPFDYSGQTVIIEDMDYGLFYLDAVEHPEHYIGKEIVFTAKYCESQEPGADYFIPGRHVMTCCEDDIQFLGFICYIEDGSENRFSHGDWVKVRVKFDYKEHEMYDYEEGPVLTLISIEPAQQPQQELVTFS